MGTRKRARRRKRGSDTGDGTPPRGLRSYRLEPPFGNCNRSKEVRSCHDETELDLGGMEPEPAGDLDPVARARPAAEALRTAPVLDAVAGLVKALALVWAGAGVAALRPAARAILPHPMRTFQGAGEPKMKWTASGPSASAWNRS